MKLNNKNIRKTIRDIADDIIKDKYLLYIDDMEHPEFYTLDIFIGKEEDVYMQVLIEKDKEYTKKELENIIKKACQLPHA